MAQRAANYLIRISRSRGGASLLLRSGPADHRTKAGGRSARRRRRALKRRAGERSGRYNGGALNGRLCERLAEPPPPNATQTTRRQRVSERDIIGALNVTRASALCIPRRVFGGVCEAGRGNYVGAG